MQLPPELAFLAPLLQSPGEEYKSAVWLLSDFDSPIWKYSFEYKKNPKELDWDVKMSDGSSLLDEKNKATLLGFKYFLTTSTRNDSDTGETNDITGQQAREFWRACHIIDFLLLNDARYKISTYGLAGLTGGNLIELLDTVSKNTSISESVYDWTNMVKEYCYNLLKGTDESRILDTLKQRPQLLIITSEQKDDDEMGIPFNLIPPIRACLYLNDMYGSPQVDYGYQPNTIRLSQVLYPGCLWGKGQPKTTHHILGFNDDVSMFTREHPGVPAHTGTNSVMRDQTYFGYRSSLYNLGILHEIGLPAPQISALMEANAYAPELGIKGRFRTVPSDIVFKSIRHAIEFHIEHGEEITKGFCRVALECQKRSVAPSTLSEAEVQNIVGPYLVNLGVTQLSLSSRIIDSKTLRESVKGEKTEYFRKLRANAGLYDLLACYVGGVQLVVGVLMARRVSELYALKANNCLSKCGDWLHFGNAKSTKQLFGFRRTEARPIEPISADMIKNLVKMQKILLRIGYIKSYKTLFALPDMRGLKLMVEASNTRYNRNLDIFCDYFEMPLNDIGQRWYLRQHQMRRFFAMLFFYCGSFSNLDTLRWMLGHSDIQHVWNYITESTDGAILASAAAQHAAENIHIGNTENFKELVELIKERYQTENYTLISTSDLEEYINDLLNEGMIEIGPEFFQDADGKHVKIVSRLKYKAAA
ncbi:integrase [Pseudomonas oryzihabitans]|uniref:integrase n=1 Tax=Pseudomonas oryzihabitans TaxID=47885 RepID=UPI0028ADC796|nr:integrase [Pseudomonas oryzihabitans]